MASGHEVEYRLGLKSNASAVLERDSAAAAKFDSSMWQVQKTLASFGVGLGATFMIDAAKNWTQAAADYEVAMLKIKNSSDIGMGFLNQEFINKQVDHYKLKLQETVDAYGNFLFKIKNADLTGEIKNKLFDELNIVGKVGGLSQSKMDQITYELGTLLGAGVLESRQLRMLGNVHPNLMPFIADELTQEGYLKKGTKEEELQELYQAMSSGKLTKAAINSISVLIPAVEKYAESLKGKLPEALDTLQSHINELGVTWDRFKNSMVLDQKPEILGLVKDLESGIHWLVEHEEQIIHAGKEIFDIVKIYAEWRIALMALQAPLGIMRFFTNEWSRLTGVLGSYIPAAQKAAESNKALAESNIALAESNKASGEMGLTGSYFSSAMLPYSKKTSFAQRELDSANNSVLLRNIQIDNLLADAQIELHNKLEIADGQYISKKISNNNLRIELDEQYRVNVELENYKISLLQEEKFGSNQFFIDAAFEQERLAYERLDALKAEHIIKLDELNKSDIDNVILNNNTKTVLNQEFIERQQQLATDEILIEQEKIAKLKALRVEDATSSEMAMGLKMQQLESETIINKTGAQGLGLTASGFMSAAGKAVMPVFMIGMAADVALMFQPKHGFSKEEYNFVDLLKAAGIVTLGAGLGVPTPTIDKKERIDLANSVFEDFQQHIYNRYGHGDFKIRDNEHVLQQMLYKEQENIDRLNPNSGFDIFKVVGERNDYGGIDLKSDIELRNILKGLGIIMPDLEHWVTYNEDENKKSTSHNAPKINNGLGKETHIRGNSVYNYNINIHEMNGMKNPVFQNQDSKANEHDIAISLTKMLNQVVNDSQINRGHQ